MSEATDRPQDRGRDRRRKPAPASSETLELLDRWRATLRLELVDVIETLRPAPAPQLTLSGEPAPGSRPSLVDRGRLVELGIRIGRELAAAADLEPDPPAPTSSPTARQAPRLSPAARRQLGG